MKIKPSQLELRDFSVINFQTKFIPPEEKTDVRALFNQYEVDVNFAIKKTENNFYNVFVKAIINSDKTKDQLPGYEILTECVGIFEMIENDLSEKDIQSLVTNSSLVMTLNFLRIHLADVTSHFPLGRYFLPSIDMKDLLEQKQKLIEKSKIKKKKKTDD